MNREFFLRLRGGLGPLLRGGLGLAALIVLVSAVVTPAAAQQDVRPLLDRLDRLERDITLVQRQVYRGGASVGEASSPSSVASPMDAGTASAPGMDARLLQRIADLEAVLAGITGQIEEASFRIGQVGSRMEKLAADVEFRLGQLEQRAAPASAPADEGAHPASAPAAEAPRPVAEGRVGKDAEGRMGKDAGGRKGKDAEGRMGKDTVAAFGHAPPAESADEKPAPAKSGKDKAKEAASEDEGALPNGSAKEQYEYISSLLGQANYVAAEKALSAFLAAHPDDALAGNAQYWLGETYYVRNEFAKAAGVFAKGYQKYPKSGKAAANVLKLGLSLARLERNQDACTAFGRLASEFPNAAGDIKRRAAQERKQLGCK